MAELAHALSRRRSLNNEPDPQEDEEEGSFEVGSVVEALFDGGDEYFRGTIVKISQESEHGGSYAIQYDDGDFEEHVEPHLIRSLSTQKLPKDAAATACSNYRVDVLAEAFGMCVCGFPKKDHKIKSKPAGSLKVTAQASRLNSFREKKVKSFSAAGATPESTFGISLKQPRNDPANPVKVESVEDGGNSRKTSSQSLRLADLKRTADDAAQRIHQQISEYLPELPRTLVMHVHATDILRQTTEESDTTTANIATDELPFVAGHDVYVRDESGEVWLPAQVLDCKQDRSESELGRTFTVTVKFQSSDSSDGMDRAAVKYFEAFPPSSSQQEILFGVNRESTADMTSLNYLHEAGILHNLQVRWNGSLITPKDGSGIAKTPVHCRQAYTFISVILVAVNPLVVQPVNPSFDEYRDQPFDTMQSLAPHPYALAELAYQQLVQAQRLTSTADDTPARLDQSIVISGESGSGKTENAKIVLSYLCNRGTATTSTSSERSADRLDKRVLATNPIFEAFGNAKTKRNENSSRFGKFIRLEFTAAEQQQQWTLVGAVCETYLLEKSRVVQQAERERNFHSFYQLLHGSAAGDGFRGERREGWSLLGGEMLIARGMDDARECDVTTEALLTVLPAKKDVDDDVDDVDDDDDDDDVDGKKATMMKTVWSTLAALLYLGEVHTADLGQPDDTRQQCITLDALSQPSRASLQDASSLLSVTDSGLLKLFTQRTMVTSSSATEVFIIPLSIDERQHAKDAVIKSLYQRLFAVLVSTINRSLSSNGHEQSDLPFIGVLDIFGFETFEVNGFENLLINHANEVLQHTFNHHVFQAELGLFEREGVAMLAREGMGDDMPDNSRCVLLVAGSIPLALQATSSAVPAMAPLGVLKTLDEVSRQANPSDINFNAMVHRQMEQNPNQHWRSVPPQRKRFEFCIRHFAGDVTYSVSTANLWVQRNNDAIPDGMVELLSSSSKPLVRELANKALLLSSEDGKKKKAKQQQQQQQQQQQRGTAGNWAKPTVSSSFLGSMDSLTRLLTGTKCSFIRCIKPAFDLSVDAPSFDRSFVVTQLRYLGILQTCEVLRAGLPARLPYASLKACFEKLSVEQRDWIRSHADISNKHRSALAVKFGDAFIADDEKHSSGDWLSEQLRVIDSELSLFASALLRLTPASPLTYALGSSRMFFKAGAMDHISAIIASATAGGSLPPDLLYGSGGSDGVDELGQLHHHHPHESLTSWESVGHACMKAVADRMTSEDSLMMAAELWQGASAAIRAARGQEEVLLELSSEIRTSVVSLCESLQRASQSYLSASSVRAMMSHASDLAQISADVNQHDMTELRSSAQRAAEDADRLVTLKDRVDKLKQQYLSGKQQQQEREEGLSVREIERTLRQASRRREALHRSYLSVTVAMRGGGGHAGEESVSKLIGETLRYSRLCCPQLAKQKAKQCFGFLHQAMLALRQTTKQAEELSPVLSEQSRKASEDLRFLQRAIVESTEAFERMTALTNDWTDLVREAERRRIESLYISFQGRLPLLSVCVLRGAVNILQDLLSGFWLPDSVPNSHLIRSGGILQAASQLASHGAAQQVSWKLDVNVRDSQGMTALMLLASHGVNTAGMDLLSQSSQQSRLSSIEHEEDGVISPRSLERQLTDMLLSRKLDPCLMDSDGQTVIPMAAANGRMHILEAVLSHMRQQAKRMPEVQVLMEEQLNQAMMCACASGQADVAKFLCGTCGVNPCGSLRSHDDGDVMSFLSAVCMHAAATLPPTDDIMNAIVTDAPSTVSFEELLMRLSDLSLLPLDEDQRAAFDFVRWMLDRCEVVGLDRDGYTPLALVCLTGCLPIAQTLLECVPRDVRRQSAPPWHDPVRVKQLILKSKKQQQQEEEPRRTIVGNVKIGDRVLKCFEVFDDDDGESVPMNDDDGSWFEGEVVSFSQSKGWFTVRYLEDGDEEDLTIDEILPLRQAWIDHQDGFAVLHSRHEDSPQLGNGSVEHGATSDVDDVIERDDGGDVTGKDDGVTERDDGVTERDDDVTEDDDGEVTGRDDGVTGRDDDVTEDDDGGVTGRDDGVTGDGDGDVTGRDDGGDGDITKEEDGVTGRDGDVTKEEDDGNVTDVIVNDYRANEDGHVPKPTAIEHEASADVCDVRSEETVNNPETPNDAVDGSASMSEIAETIINPETPNDAVDGSASMSEIAETIANPETPNDADAVDGSFVPAETMNVEASASQFGDKTTTAALVEASIDQSGVNHHDSAERALMIEFDEDDWTLGLMAEYVNLQCFSDGMTPIHIASSNGYELLVRWLLAVGADSLIPNHQGEYPLVSACQHGYDAIVEELLEAVAGADLPIASLKDLLRQCLQASCVAGHVSCIQAVHSQLSSLLPSTELQEIVTQLMLETVANGNRDIAEYLFACGADLNAQNSQGETAVMIAYRHGHRDLLHFLMNRSCDDAAGRSLSNRRSSTIGTPDHILRRASKYDMPGL